MSMLEQGFSSGVSKLSMAKVFAGLALLSNAFLYLDPSDSNYGLGFTLSYLPFLFLALAATMVNPREVVFSHLDLLVFGFLSIPVFGGVLFEQQLLGEHFFRLSGLGAAYFMIKMLAKNDQFFDWFIGFFHRVILFSGLTVFGLLIMWRLGLLTMINQANQNLFHEEVFLLACLPFVPVSSLRRQRTLLFIAVFGAALTLKNTGFLLAVITGAAYILFIVKAANRVELWAKLGLFGIFIGALALMSVLFFADVLPDGNISTRSIAYQFRLEQFFNSPLIGTFFNMRNTVDVGWGRVSAHSDILDIFAGMGGLGAMLLIVPLAILLKSPSRERQKTFFLKIIVTGFLAVAALNPILMNPKLAFYFWVALGILSARIARQKHGGGYE